MSPVRPSKASRWRALALLLVHVLIAAHIVHWLLTGSSFTPVEPSEAMAFGKSGMINVGLLFFAAAILLTAVFGRYFCGWGCHLVALQDLAAWLLAKLGIKPRPLRSRLLAWVPTIAFVYMFLWPALYRLAIGDRFDRFHLDLWTRDFWATFPTWPVAVFTFVVCGFVVIYFLGSKGFCTYACPYGAIFAGADRLAPGRIRVTDACEGCGHCTATCTSNVRVHEEVRDYGMVVSAGCMKCMDCVSVCPKDALYFGWGTPALFASPRVAEPARPRPGFGWRQELFLAAAFLAVFMVVRGLYDLVPFLLSLGLAGIGAFLALQTVRLLTRRDFGWQGLALKQAGRLTPAGLGWLGAMALLLGLYAHSAGVRWLVWRADRLYAADAALRTEAMVGGPGVFLAPDKRAQAEATLHALETERRWSLAESPSLTSQLAWAQFAAGRWEAFRLAAERSLASYPEDARLRLQLGRLYAQRGRAAEAVAAYEAAIAAQPGLANAYLLLGTLLAERGDLAAAHRAFARGAAANPAAADMPYNLGLVAALEGRLEDAEASFRQALDLDPEHLQARENLAGVLAQSGRFAAAAAEFERAIARSGGDAATYALAARAYLGAGEREKARAAAERALALAPGQPDATAVLAALGREP